MRRAFAIILLGCFLAASSATLCAAPPTYRIAGVVVDSVTGQPIDGAEVTVTPVANGDEPQTFLTGPDGRFLFASLPSGRYRLSAARRGYAPQDFDQHEAYNTAIVAGPGLDSEHIRFNLGPGAVLAGIVSDDSGEPVRDAKILLFQQSVFGGSRTLRNIKQTITDDQGRYRFAHLLPGIYAVAVSARPWYAQAAKYIQSPGPRSDAGASDNSAAQFTWTELGEGPQSGPVSPLFDVVYPVTFFSSTTRLSDAARLSLTAGASETADLQLHAVPSLHLRVSVPVEPALTVTSRDDDGQETTSQVESPAAIYASLRIGDAYTERLQARSTEIAPGVIELSGLPPGEINLVSTSFASEQSYVSRAKTVDLTADTAISFNPQGATTNVSGVVLSGQLPAAAPPGESASPDQAAVEAPSGLSISFRSVASGETYDAPISSKGAFSFSGSLLPAGAYEVELVELLSRGNLRVSSVEATGAIVSGRTVDIPADQPVSLIVHTMEPKCAVSGFALKSGKPFSGAMVLLVSQESGPGGPRYYRDQSDSDGSFLIGGLYPGRYTLLAIENGWDLEWADPAVLIRYLPAGKPVDLAPGAAVRLNAKVQE